MTTMLDKMLEQLEPVVRAAPRLQPSTLSDAVAASQAISLKRIADALEAMNPGMASGMSPLAKGGADMSALALRVARLEDRFAALRFGHPGAGSGGGAGGNFSGGAAGGGGD